MRRRLDIARLADLVDRSRLSQNHWAIRLGLSRGHWSDLLKGRHPYPSARTRQRIAEVFGVDEDELFIAETQGTPDLDFRQAMFARFEITGELVFAMAWLVFVLSIGAIFLLMAMIRDGELSKVSSLFYLVPGVTALMAWALFGEALTPVQIAGMAIAAFGVSLATRRAPVAPLRA